MSIARFVSPKSAFLRDLLGRGTTTPGSWIFSRRPPIFVTLRHKI